MATVEDKRLCYYILMLDIPLPYAALLGYVRRAGEFSPPPFSKSHYHHQCHNHHHNGNHHLQSH